MATKPNPGSPSKPAGKKTLDPADEQRRLKDVESARTIFSRFVQDSTSRSNVFAQTRGQLEGNRPFDPRTLEQQGAAWQTNINWGDAQAMRDRALVPYWKMVHDVPHAIAVEIDSNTPKADTYQVAFSEAFDQFLADWSEDYIVQHMASSSDFINFGAGPVMWDDRDSPRFAHVNYQRVYFPKNARMSPDSWDVVAIVRDVSPSDLYIKVKDKATRKTSKDAGWNLDALERAIVFGMYGNSKREPRDYTRAQDDLVQNDITYASVFEPLQLIWMFVRQFTGEIGCYVFTRSGDITEFLFKDDNYADNWRNLLGIVWYDTGVDSLVHSIKGFAIKNFAFANIINRIKCRMVDSATLAFGINLQRNTENTPDEAPPVENYGPFTVIPEGFTQLQFYPQLQQGMAVIESLSQNQAENNSLYRQQQENQIQQSDTATQANLLASMSSEITEAGASLYLAQIGANHFTECVRRLRRKGNTDKDAKKFVERMHLKNVPDEIIFDADIRVKTGANSGMASPSSRIQKWQQALQLMNAPGVNGRYILENLFSELFGSQGGQRAMLPQGVDSNPLQRREAMIENSMFGQGMPLPVDPSDAHFEHAQVHLAPLAQIAQQYKQTQQLNAEQMQALTIGMEHTGEHMQALSQDETKKAEFMQIRPIFSQVQSVARGAITQLQAQQQKQQQMGGPMQQ